MEEWIVDILKVYGLAGVAMAAMAWAIRTLWYELKEVRQTLFDTGTKAIEANLAMSNAVQQLRTDLLTTNVRARRGGSE